MELAIGILIGMALAGIAVAAAAYFLLRDNSPADVPLPSVPVPGAPAITVLLIESFLNQQLEQLMLSQAAAPVPVGPVTLHLQSVRLQLLPGAQARLTTGITAAALGLPVRLKPVTEIAFYVEACRVRVRVTKILVEGIQIPRKWVDGFLQSYLAEAEAKLNENLTPLQAATGVRLSLLETNGDILTVTFV